MLHFSTEETYNNEQVSTFLGRISSETCLKMDYFDSKSPILTKRWAQTSLLLAISGFAARFPLRLNN